MGIRLCERDFEIMLGLARNSFMGIWQIQKKWFPSYVMCIKRLGKLRKNDYLDVVYISRNGKGIYYLTKNGVEFVNGYYGTEYKRYDKNGKMPHYISCSEFYINLPSGIYVNEYQIEYCLGDFIPDVYMNYSVAGGCNGDSIDCFVEIDNLGRKSRFNSKIKKYENYYMSDKWRGVYGKFPKCLVVSKGRFDIESKIPFKIIGFGELERLGEVLL